MNNEEAEKIADKWSTAGVNDIQNDHPIRMLYWVKYQDHKQAILKADKDVREEKV